MRGLNPIFEVCRFKEQLFVAKGFDWIHASGTHGRQESRDYAHDSENSEGDEHDFWRGTEEDVALVVCGLVDVGVERHGWDEIGDEDCDDHSDDTGEEGEGQTLEEKLLQDVSAAGAERFEKADFACALGD